MRILAVFILFIGIVLNTQVKACGWDPYEGYSYHLFDQRYIEAEGYGPFIKEEYYGSWASNHDKAILTKNIQLWQDLLSGWSAENIEKALMTEDNVVFENLWKGKKDGVGQNVYNYMSYARKCSDMHKSRKRYSWSYNDNDEKKVPDLTELLDEGYAKFTAETNLQLKLRYAYQMIRNYHYSQRYDEAVQFYNNKVKDRYTKNEMYYYITDQVAGCYYSLEDYDKAAYLFLNVFNHSYDRKVSAYTSYKFCTDRGGEGKAYFKTAEDTAAYITLKSIRDYTDQTYYLKEISEAAPKSEKMELLFVRTLYELEDDVFPQRIGLSKKHLLCNNAEDNCWDRVERMIQISEQEEKLCKIERADFWRLCTSYLYFLKGDIVKADIKLKAIQNYTKYAKLGEQLKLVYKVFSWNELGEAEQVSLASVLKHENLTEDNIGLIEEYAGHLLFHQGDLAQAFLMHNSLGDVKNMGSLKLLQELKGFIHKKDKTPLEIFLDEQSVVNKTGKQEAVDFIDYQIGMYYMNTGDTKRALSCFSNIKQFVSGEGVGYKVPAKVFSNNLKECFDCSDSLMEDQVYEAAVFSFIPREMTKKQLAVTILKLDSMSTSTDIKQWKRKLAYYLLGNYYFNVSNTGYYRGMLKDRSNCCNSWYFGWGNKVVDERNQNMESRTGYNLCNVSFSKKAYFGLADKAYGFYRHVIELSSDKELNARCLYMMAKCELNDMYNHEKGYNYWAYDGNMKNNAVKYKKSFEVLKNGYEDTEFFNRIINECSFFRYYCTQ